MHSNSNCINHLCTILQCPSLGCSREASEQANEANNATNLYNIFTEILESIPKDVLIDNETLGLFKNALEDTIGEENAKSKLKKYI